ncbi:hypothetical protein [Xenorhabdus sp. KJ12.1]|uniref:hypothetical protein n=1 Tax=Xenorhabdus sp. KJ12.1 TaxID=1851571 RepID=UPI000C03AD72|nr:hypothetical protein [Xenorhabdus sp. KJ12.1]PHM70361.1 phage tail protein [Xenorhabdus sp. KJ12.1]
MTKTFKVPFAAQGDRVSIPDQPREDGTVSYAQGYGSGYGLDPNEDPAAMNIEREKMNGIFHDITEAVGDIQTFGAAQWTMEGQPYPLRGLVYHKQKLWQSRIENNKEEPKAGNAWVELKADLTADEVGAYSKEESDARFQLQGNYAPAGNYALKGESYTKPESDGKYQPKGQYLENGYSYSKAESNSRYESKGNYAPAGNYALKGESYTKPESDGKYQSKGNYQPAGNYQLAGNYALRGESYTKGESNSRYQLKGAGVNARRVFSGSWGKWENVGFTEDVRGKYLLFRGNGSGWFAPAVILPVGGWQYEVSWYAGGYPQFHIFTLAGDGRSATCQDSSWKMGEIWVID